MMSLDDWKNVFNKNTITSVIYKDNTVNKVILGSTTYWQRLTSISISGAAQVGQKFTASVTPSSTSPTYQWYRGSNAISGANGSSYTVTSSDVGYQLHCKATASGQTVDSNYSSTVDYVWTYNSFSTNTYHRGGGVAFSAEDTKDLGGSYQIYSCTCTVNSNKTNTPTYVLYGSTNNSNWTEIGRTSHSGSGTFSISITSSSFFRYVKIYQSESQWRRASDGNEVCSIEPWAVTYRYHS